MRRTAGEFYGELNHVNFISFLEATLAKPMLFAVMRGAETNRPLVGRFEAGAPVRSEPYVRALNRLVRATRHGA